MLDLFLAQEKGYFKEEIAPVTLKTRKGDKIFDVDEHPKPATTLEGLSKLPPVFKKNGTVTAGNASVSPFFRNILFFRRLGN